MTKSMTKFMTNSMTKSITKSMTKYNKFFTPNKMLLTFPHIIILLFNILIGYWNYYQYSERRKRFNGYKNVVPEPFERKRKTLLFMVQLTLVKHHS